MNVLGIETATLVCGVAVVRNAEIRSERQVVERNIHAESIMRMLDEALLAAELSVKQIDAISVSIGPGSFTGLRIGLSVAKGLSYALDTHIVAVPTLLALAERSHNSVDVGTEFILPAIDARRNEVYCQLFRRESGSLIPVWDVRDYSIESLAETMNDLDVSITGDAALKLKEQLRFSRTRFVEGEDSQCSAGTIALMGERMAERGEFANVASLEPMYVKEFFTIMKN